MSLTAKERARKIHEILCSELERKLPHGEDRDYHLIAVRAGGFHIEYFRSEDNPGILFLLKSNLPLVSMVLDADKFGDLIPVNDDGYTMPESERMILLADAKARRDYARRHRRFANNVKAHLEGEVSPRMKKLADRLKRKPKSVRMSYVRKDSKPDLVEVEVVVETRYKLQLSTEVFDIPEVVPVNDFR